MQPSYNQISWFLLDHWGITALIFDIILKDAHAHISVLKNQQARCESLVHRN